MSSHFLLQGIFTERSNLHLVSPAGRFFTTVPLGSQIYIYIYIYIYIERERERERERGSVSLEIPD